MDRQMKFKVTCIYLSVRDNKSVMQQEAQRATYRAPEYNVQSF